MRRLTLAVAFAAVLTLTACGSPSADLFEVTRSGADANANVKLLVSDGGSVTCNDGPAKPIDAERLLEARELTRALAPQAALSVQLEPTAKSTLRYSVRAGAGTVEFSDTSPGRTNAMNRIVAFTKTAIEEICGIER